MTLRDLRKLAAGMPPAGPTRAGSGVRLRAPSDDEETKTRCPVPACKAGYVELKKVQSGVYSYLRCSFCGGEGLVSASRRKYYYKLQQVLKS